MKILYRKLVLFLVLMLSACAPKKPGPTDILILEMGSPATPNLVERLEKLGVSYEIYPGFLEAKDIRTANPKAIIITGSAKSLLDDHDAPYASDDFYTLNIPILGLCYGMQMIVEQLGGKVKKCSKSEKGIFPVTFNGKCGLTPAGMDELEVLMDHDDCVVDLPKGFVTDASSSITQNAFSCSHDKQMYLIQFHPERYDTAPESGIILDLFIHKVMNK